MMLICFPVQTRIYFGHMLKWLDKNEIFTYTYEYGPFTSEVSFTDNDEAMAFKQKFKLHDVVYQVDILSTNEEFFLSTTEQNERLKQARKWLNLQQILHNVKGRKILLSDENDVASFKLGWL